MHIAGMLDSHAPARIHAPPTTPPPAGPAIRADRWRVIDAASHGTQVSRLALRADGTTGDAAADRALRAAAAVDQALLTRFGRDGIDGHGGITELEVHASDRTNAYWDGAAKRIELGDGDGVTWGAFGDSVSVVAHELYHGVVDAEVKLDYDQPQQAALNESLADVFAAGVTGSWRIGEDVLTPGVAGDAIRDLAHPQLADLRDAARVTEAHALSGVASLAAVRVADRIGMDAMQQVWYRALVDDLVDGAGFAQAAAATAKAASTRFGEHSSQHDAVVAAWESVGVHAAT